MTTGNLDAVNSRVQETIRFVERALIDFGLMDAFESRSPYEQAECLQRIAAAVRPKEQDHRVSVLLDDLARGAPLAPSRA
jgi:hypothetical protein